jgi:hypothetical protein
MVRLTCIALLLLPLAATGQDKAEKSPPPATVTVTAEIACLHCTFGEGEGCAVCLKLDSKTPVLLGGKLADQFREDRLTKKTVVVTGVLTIGKDKHMLLTGDKGTFASKADEAAKGQTKVTGTPVCGKCDLKLCEECTLAIANGPKAIVLDGKRAQDHADDYKGITAVGRLFLDKRGLLRLDAAKVDTVKK